MSDAIEMPPFRIAAAALRKTTEQLATWIEQPPSAPPNWSELEWAVARATAAMHGISGLLAKRLPWSGPTAWRAFLDQQHNESVLREKKVDALIERIDHASRQAGISCVGLKGSALRELNLYEAGERPMGDVDLLVRAPDVEHLGHALVGFGYTKRATLDRNVIYADHSSPKIHGFGEHSSNPMPIEVHTRVAEPLPVTDVDITHLLTPALGHPGVRPYSTRSALMLHLLLHTTGNLKSKALRYIQLHDIAILGRQLGEAEWQGVLAPTPESGSWWLLPALALTERYFPNSVPQEVLSRAHRACPPVLRLASNRYSLTDVSWSNLRISALPGLAFSRTPAEVLRLVRKRLLPNRKALSELEEGLERKPHLTRVPWYGLPHRARILRWVFSRPPRVQTMISLRASLGNQGISID